MRRLALLCVLLLLTLCSCKNTSLDFDMNLHDQIQDLPDHETGLVIPDFGVLESQNSGHTHTVVDVGAEGWELGTPEVSGTVPGWGTYTLRMNNNLYPCIGPKGEAVTDAVAWVEEGTDKTLKFYYSTELLMPAVEFNCYLDSEGTGSSDSFTYKYKDGKKLRVEYSCPDGDREYMMFVVEILASQYGVEV